jgi:trehalose synthase
MSDGPALHPVEVAPRSIERFSEVLDEAGYDELLALADRAQGLLADRAVWCVNSTAQGGGVAEMLQSLMAYTRGAGADTRWLVMAGPPEFFALTKRIHNALHAAEGVRPPGEEDREVYERTTRRAAEALLEMAQPGDVVILHDPQTAGMAKVLRDHGLGLVWRSHVGVDAPDDTTRAAWDFLRPYVTAADRYVFSRVQFVGEGLDQDRTTIIPPSIDAFSPKNQGLEPEAVGAILSAVGLCADGRGSQAAFQRQDGTAGRVEREAHLDQEQPLPDGARIVAQVSRWDRLKDPLGVLRGFVEHVADGDAHLVLAGPDVERVADDPEGAEVLEEVRGTWRELPDGTRARVHVATLPMVDGEENAAIVNAIQSRADIVVQKSLAEGFGLTVAEAMWKGRPVVASRVGGIQDQVIDGESGLLVAARDLDGFGAAVSRLLEDPPLAEQMGTAARERVRQEFLESRHLRQWVETLERLGDH